MKFAIVGCGRIAQRHAENIPKRGKLIVFLESVLLLKKQLQYPYTTNLIKS